MVASGDEKGFSPLAPGSAVSWGANSFLVISATMLGTADATTPPVGVDEALADVEASTVIAVEPVDVGRGDELIVDEGEDLVLARIDMGPVLEGQAQLVSRLDLGVAVRAVDDPVQVHERRDV